MIDISKINKVRDAISSDLNFFLNAQAKIKDSLLDFTDGKNLKGDELTGWLGEIFAKLLLDGTLVDESQEHDFIVLGTGEKYAVKARKGRKGGWNNTSAISKIEGDDCPTYLLFIHFDSEYRIENIWKYDLGKKKFEERIMDGILKLFPQKTFTDESIQKLKTVIGKFL